MDAIDKMDPAETLRYYKRRKEALWRGRSSYDAHYRELGEMFAPRTGKWGIRYDPNPGRKKHGQILEGTPEWCVLQAQAGLMAGASSPARPFFRLTTADPDLARKADVARWLKRATERVLRVFQRSNFYRALPRIYTEMIVYGTAATTLMPHWKRVVHYTPLTAGMYAVQKGADDEVVTLYRELTLPVGQLVSEFGLANVSDRVKSLYNEGHIDTMIDVVHAIEPRHDRDPRRLDDLNMAWSSCYFEEGAQDNRVLRMSGFPRFPALVARWNVVGDNVYGDSLCMPLLGDARQLQHQQKRKAQGIDLQVNPPLEIPSSLKNRDVDRLPGGLTSAPSAGAGGRGITPLYQVNLDLNGLREDMDATRQRIYAGTFVDLFRMMTRDDDPQRTAYEVSVRKETQMVQLGPVYGHIQSELHEPSVDFVFERLLRAGELDEPPEELLGAELTVQFVSTLAQAQRAVGQLPADRLIGTLQAVSTLKPDVVDGFDADEWLRRAADELGVDPHLVVPGDQVALVREARSRAQAARQQSEVLAEQAGAARDFAQAGATAPAPQTSGAQVPPPADVLNLYTGYESPASRML